MHSKSKRHPRSPDSVKPDPISDVATLDESAARLGLRRSTLRRAVGLLLLIFVLPWFLLMAVSLWVWVFPAFVGVDGSVLGQAIVLYPFVGLGEKAVEDVAWILPSLLALIIAIYVGDYGQLRRGEQIGEAQVDEDGRRARRILAFAGIVVGALALDYLVMAVGAVIFGEADPGHLVGLVIVGVWIPIFGVVVGQFDQVRIEDQVRGNETAREHVAVQLDRIPKSKKVVARPGLTVALWLLAPFGVFVLELIVFLTFAQNAWGFEALQVAGFVGLFQLPLAAAATNIRALQIDNGRDKTALFVIVALLLASTGVLALVVVAFLEEPLPYRVAPAIAALLMVVLMVVWFTPPSVKRASAVAAWLPSRASIERRRRALEKEEIRLKVRARELASNQRALRH